MKGAVIAVIGAGSDMREIRALVEAAKLKGEVLVVTGDQVDEQDLIEKLKKIDLERVKDIKKPEPFIIEPLIKCIEYEPTEKKRKGHERPYKYHR